MAISDNRSQTGSLAMSLVVSPLVVVAIILRFIATRKSARRVGAEDWCAFLATLSCLGFNVISIWCIAVLNGREFTQIPLETLPRILKASYITTQFFPLNQFFAKTSILLLYNRIFGIFVSYRRAIYVLFVLNLLWTIAASLTLFLQCTPVDYYWNRFRIQPSGGKCIDEADLLIGFEVPNSSIDFAMVGLALVMLRDLKMRRASRWKVMGFFAAGGLAGIIGFIKIAAHFTAGQMSSTVLSLWGNAQMFLSILCCCVPIYNSLFSRKQPQSQFYPPTSESNGSGWCSDPKFGHRGTATGTTTSTTNTDVSLWGSTVVNGDNTKGSINVSREYGMRKHYHPGTYGSYGQPYGPVYGTRDEKIQHHHDQQPSQHQYQHGHSRNASADSSVSAALAPKMSNFSTRTGQTLTNTTTANSHTPLFQPTAGDHGLDPSMPRELNHELVPTRLQEPKGTSGMEWDRLYDQVSSDLSRNIDLGVALTQTPTTVSGGIGRTTTQDFETMPDYRPPTSQGRPHRDAEAQQPNQQQRSWAGAGRDLWRTRE